MARPSVELADISMLLDETVNTSAHQYNADDLQIVVLHHHDNHGITTASYQQ